MECCGNPLVQDGAEGSRDKGLRERLDGAVWSKAREGQNALDDGGLGWAMGKRGGSECLPQRHDADDADDGDH